MCTGRILLTLFLFASVCWQELERRLALQEQDMVIVKTVKSEVARLPDMEKELKHLREENLFLRWTPDKRMSL